MTARLRRASRLASLAARSAMGAVAVARVARAAGAAPPVRPTVTPQASIDVVVPARDEAARIGPLLDRIVGAPGVARVIVVDDESTDATAAVAAAAGAEVVAGRPRPDGWAGKAWALQQGLEAATAEWVVTLDADVRPDPRLAQALVARAVGDRLDLVTAGGRFECPTAGAAWLHPAMLTTLVYRFGPPGAATRPDRAMGNGQCMAGRRVAWLAAGGMEPVRGEVVEDVALVRHLARAGMATAFLDANELLEVRMFESLADTWHGWGRSLALPGVESPGRQWFDLAVVALAQAAPLPRLLARRGDLVDAVLLAVRIGTLVGTRRAYRDAGPAYWASPLADGAAVAAIARGIRRGTRQVWRGRSYG